MKLNYSIGSDRGLVRKNNEDSAYAGANLLALADGMGGHAAGEVASQIMIGHIKELDTDPGDNDMLALLASIADDANHAIARRIREKPETDGMGTTLTSLMFNGTEFGLCHVGDSRGYRLRDGQLEQITSDDTYVQSLVDRGELDPEDVSTHPQRSMILKAYTGRAVEPTLNMVDAKPGDRLMLCSDGLSDPVTFSTIHTILAEEATPEGCVNRLIELALRSGGPDNVTVLVADVVDDEYESSQLPTVAVTAGAINGETQEDPRPDTAAGRAAIAISAARESQSIAPTLSNDADSTPPAAVEKPKKKRKGFKRGIFFLIVLIALGGGLFFASNVIKERYFITTTPDNQILVIHQGLNSDILGGLWNTPYQEACLNANENLTMISYGEKEDCNRFKLVDLKESARGSVATLPGGSYGEVLQQMQRLADEALPVCVTRESETQAQKDGPQPSQSTQLTTTVTDGNLNTPGVTCREVK